MPTIRRPELALLLQAILIALPVAVLAGGALSLLRNDLTEVEQQARESARVVAPELAHQLEIHAGEELSRHQDPGGQGKIVDGRVSLVTGFPKLPTPDDWPLKLTAQQAQGWKIAQDATYRQPDAATARKALSALAASAPADSMLRSNAELELLELADWSDHKVNRTERAVDLAHRFPYALTPSGTPVSALALLLALQHTRAGSMPEDLIREVETNTVDYPSFLTPELLQVAKQAALGGMYADRVATLEQHWQRQEAAREQTREALHTLLDRPIPADRPSEFWLGEGEQSSLAFTNPMDGGWDVRLVPSALLVASLQKTVVRGRLPEFAGVVVEIGGERHRVIGAADTGISNPVILASAYGVFTVGRPHSFRLDLDLSNPAPLYAKYQRRRRLIEWMIFAAVTTALIGLVTLWTGHRRQTRLNEMKSNFVSSVSHELRAPIAAVQLMAESLESGRVTGESRQQDYYHLIVQECRRLSTLVGNVLDFARIDQGRQRYHFEPVDVTKLLRHTVMLMRPNAEQRQVRLVLCDPAGSMQGCQANWDGGAVEQSLVNLLDNAIKHSPEGAEVRVELEVRKDSVRLWVRDRGPGIPASEHERIFERFYRRGQELRRETKGVGIGLSIVKHVAEGHGGRVVVESIVSEGSSFGLELPLNVVTQS